MGLNLSEAADISRRDEIWLRGQDGVGFLLTKRSRDLGLINVVGARGSAAEMGI